MRTRRNTVVSVAAAFGIALSAAAQDGPGADGRDGARPHDSGRPVSLDEPADQPEVSGEAVGGELDPGVLAAGQAALAEQFAEMAQLALRGGRLDEAEFRQAAALFRAAATLNPGEPRFWRLLTEAELQVGSGDGALSALQGYRNVAPDDRVAQIQLIELHASRMEAGDDALKYLRNLLSKESLPAEVRSHVAVQVARRLLDRGEVAQAPAALEQALKLNPVNVAALDLRYELVSRGGSPPERAAGLLGLLRANPIRPATMAELARLLAGAGMGKESLEWFTRALDLYGVAGAPDRLTYHDLIVDYAAQVYLAGQFQAARGVTDQLLKSDPADVDAWLLRLVIDRGAEESSGVYAKTRQAAEAELWQRWGAVAREVMTETPSPADAGGGGAGTGEGGEETGRGSGETGEGSGDTGGSDEDPAAAGAADTEREAPRDDGAQDAPADARPAKLDFPEPAVVAERAKASRDEHEQALFVSAAADFAWFEVYFNEDPGAAGKWIDALEAVLPADNVTLVRLRGWTQLANQQHAEARQTLTPVRDTDPLSALGLLRLPSGGGAGDEDAERGVAADDDDERELLARHPAGLVGAILSQGLKDHGLKPEPSPEAAAVRQELQKFPRAWLDIVGDPQRFYAIRVEPLRVAHRFGEPMFVRVMLQNLTDFDISIGDDGVIRPGLWFDAHAQAMKGVSVPGAAFERLGQATVLPARQAIAQYVRFDQGKLAELLSVNPSPQLQISGWCMTNPVRQGDAFGPGPGGLRVPFAKKMARTGFPVNRAGSMEELVRGAETGLPEVKVRHLNLMAVLVPLLRDGGQPATQPRQQQDQPGPAEQNIGEGSAQGPRPRQGGPEAAERGAPVAAHLVEKLAERAADEVPSVAQWAKFELAHVGEPEQQAEAIESLLADARWEGRLLGLIAAPKLGAGKAEDVAAKVSEADDEEPLVRDYAAALVELLQRPVPTTRGAEAADAAPESTDTGRPAAEGERALAPPAPDAPGPDEGTTDVGEPGAGGSGAATADEPAAPTPPVD